MLFPYAKSSISLIFVKKTQFSSLKKRLFIAYITKILGGIFLVCKNLSFGIVKSKIDHFRKVPCEHTVGPRVHGRVLSWRTLTGMTSCCPDSFIKTTPPPPGYPWVSGLQEGPPQQRILGLVLDHQVFKGRESKNLLKLTKF